MRRPSPSPSTCAGDVNGCHETRERPRASRGVSAIAEAIRRERAIAPAAEWLVDKLPIVDEQLREIRDDLPRGYYQELPKLADGPLDRAFAELAQRLRDQDPAVTPALRWLDARLAAQGTTADQLVQLELESQTSANVTVRNVITSMRLMSSFDWADFFESVSPVDEVLRANSDFAAMDFTTRDHYRHAIEQIARRRVWNEREGKWMGWERKRGSGTS